MCLEASVLAVPISAVVAASGVVLTLAANVVLAERARRHKRQAIIAAFRSDIRSVVQVLDQLKIVELYAAVTQPSFLV